MSRYISLEAPTVLGMGAVGPTLAILTAALCSAFGGLLCDSSWLYPTVMLFLSGAMAVFPTARSKYPTWMKAALWPVLAAVIFASAWTSSSGLSLGEEKLRDIALVRIRAVAESGVPSGVPMEPGTNTLFSIAPMYNEGEGVVVGRVFKRLR